MKFRAGKHFGRKLRHSIRKGGSIVRRAATSAKTIIGRVDKMSDGALTKALQSDPRTKAMLTGVNMVGKD